MKKLILLIPFFIFANSFTFNPEEPIQGQIFSVSFIPEFIEPTALKGIFVVEKKDTTEVKLLTPFIKNERVEFKIKIPKDAELLEFKFEDNNGNAIDDSGTYFVKVITDTLSKPVWNTYYRWARTYLRFTKYDIEKVKNLLKAEINFHPSNWFATDLLWQIEIKQDSTKLPYVRYLVDSLLHEAKDSIEMLYFVILKASADYLRWPELADSMLTLCAEKYPASKYWLNSSIVKPIIQYLHEVPQREKKFEENIFPMLKGDGKESAYYILFVLSLMNLDKEKAEIIAKTYTREFPNSKYAPAMLLVFTNYAYPTRDSSWLEEVEKIYTKYPENEQVVYSLASYYREINEEKAYKFYKKLLEIRRTPYYIKEFIRFLADKKRYRKEFEKLIDELEDSLNIDFYRKKLWWLNFEERKREQIKDYADIYCIKAIAESSRKNYEKAKELIYKADSMLKAIHVYDKSVFYCMKKVAEKTKDIEMEKRALLGILFEERTNKGIITRLKEIYKKEHNITEEFDNFLDKKIKEFLLDYRLHQPAPIFSTKDINGETIDLSKLKGKIVVINFWATWCGPCRREIPDLNSLVERFKNDSEVVFLAISGEEKNKIVKFIEKNPFNYRLIYDADNILKMYSIQSIPTHIIIDKKGYIQFKIVGATPGIEEMLEDWIKALK